MILAVQEEGLNDHPLGQKPGVSKENSGFAN